MIVDDGPADASGVFERWRHARLRSAPHAAARQSPGLAAHGIPAPRGNGCPPSRRSPGPPEDGQLTDSLAEPSVLSSAAAQNGGAGRAISGGEQPERAVEASGTVRPSVNRPFRNPLKSNE
jgi:hypothetical protein